MTRLEAALMVVGSLAVSCRCAGARPETNRSEPPSTEPAEPRVAAHTDAGLSKKGEPTSPVDAAPPPPPEPEALSAPRPFVELAVEGFRNAVVSLPLGARGKRPVMVALHGNYDRPEWQCEVWRDITGGYPFILCPRGIPRGDAPKSADRWTYGGLGATKKELEAGLAALDAAYPDYVDDGEVLFTGFSLGAILGVHIIRKNPERYPRAVLTEGGYKGWSLGAARSLKKGGAQRVLFACGQTACRHTAKGPARFLEKAEIGAKVVFNGNVGHTYDGKVADAIAKEWSWLVEGDERWTPEQR